MTWREYPYRAFAGIAFAASTLGFTAPAPAGAAEPASIGTVTLYAGQPSEIFRFAARQTNDYGRDTGTGGATGKVVIGPFTIVKAHDATSPVIFLDNARAKHLPQVRIDLPSQGPGGPISTSYLLEDVGIISDGATRLSRSQRVFERVALQAFSRVTVTVTTGEGTTESCWDVAHNEAC